MNVKKLLSLTFLLIFTLPATAVCADADSAAQQAITAAKAAQQKAASIQGGWVTTDKLIRQAEKAASGGDSKKAVALAEKAKHEAERAYAQAEHEKQHWSPPPYAIPK